jgi:putative ABC transport system ATP-binding protein
MSGVPVVDLRDVARTYPGFPPVQALRPTTLQIMPGAYVAVTGPSGSGKSTLLNLLGLLDRPSAGRYYLDGIDVGALSERERAAVRGHRIGFVFQAFHLLPHRSATENVALARLYTSADRPKERSAAAIEMLTRVGMAHRLNALPTILSGGECQRVVVARALANNPRLLLCDEPTGNLDSSNSTVILDLLDRLHRGGVTIVVITHDPNTAARAERQVTIRDGLVSERLQCAQES